MIKIKGIVRTTSSDSSCKKNFDLNLIKDNQTKKKLGGNTCKPNRANTERAKRVRMITSRKFFTDSITAPTIVFSP